MQRFGREGNTIRLGLDLLAGHHLKRQPAMRVKKLAFNAVQSAIFNDVLMRRITDGTVNKVQFGDRVEWFDERKFILVESEEELADAQEAVEKMAASITGPIAGPRHPETTGEPRRVELDAYSYFHVTDDSFRVAKKLAKGTRRPFLVPLGEFAVEVVGADALRVKFSLPSGVYATVVMRELFKSDDLEG